MALKNWMNSRLTALLSRYPRIGMFWARTLPMSYLSTCVPWEPPQRPLSESTLAFISVGGVRKRGQKAFVGAPDGDVSFRAIDIDTPFSRLVRTPLSGADQRGDSLKHLLPLPTLVKLQGEAVQRVHGHIYSFSGWCSTGKLSSLTTVSCRALAKVLKHDSVDLVLVVPEEGGDRCAGWIARELECCQLPAIVLMSDWEVIREVRPPRTLYLPLSKGWPFGRSDLDARTLLEEMLEGLHTIEQSGTVLSVEHPDDSYPSPRLGEVLDKDEVE